MARYWIGVASREHVLRGLVGGFCQLCHGKAAAIRRLAPGDGIVYYAPKESFGADEPCRRFVALGRIAAGEPYQHEMAPGIVPWRRDVDWRPIRHEAPIAPLVPALDFIADKRRWAAPFRFGLVAIGEADFRRIADACLAPEESPRLPLAG
jgi:hypothetical protein